MNYLRRIFASARAHPGTDPRRVGAFHPFRVLAGAIGDRDGFQVVFCIRPLSGLRVKDPGRRQPRKINPQPKEKL